ncbi:unnamed protein product [Mucor circinelloides]
MSERDEETAFIPPQPLVPDSENNRRYILHISDNEEGEEDRIEKMYGPFEDALDTLPPYPKPYARLTRTADRIRAEEILKLREAIRDMEQRRAQNLEKKRLKEIEEEWRVETNGYAEPCITFKENEERTVKQKASAQAAPETIVIESDTDDAMDVEEVNTEAVTESSEMQESEQSMSAEDSHFTSDNEDSDNDSFQTARDVIDDIDPEMQLMDDDAAKIEKQMEDLNREMEAHMARKKDIKLKLLGIKVKLSIEKNRKELTGRRTAVQASSPPPKLGIKRAHTDETLPVNQNPWRPAQPEYNTLATIQHQIPTQPMAFSQQIPPQMQQHFSHPQAIVPIPQQPVVYNNRYDIYMNGLPPPPPPPDTMPPPYIPPPPPPPPLDTMTSAYPVGYSNYKRYKRNNATSSMNRHKDAWHPPAKRFTAPIASPYADLTSPISKMENADEIQNALVHVSDLISVRIFGDEKHNHFPAKVERNLPKIRRLVTTGKRTFASPPNVANQENKTSNHIVFFSPAGVPAQLQINDTCHESPFLGLLYRKFQEKPFHSVMEFAVPSIFSWISQDVDLSSLYSNELGGIPLYADKLAETYNMVCDLCSAYPNTEFLGALKLELSMYVNGRESEAFMRDCQACVSQYKDSIDVFWQIVLAEPERSKQTSLIQNHLKSIKVSSDTVTMVISEKTTEILIRTLRLFGIAQVLELLSDGKITKIDESEGGIILLDQIQYVNDDGKYFIWMSILHYYVTNTLPVDVCDIWMNTLVKNGTPSQEKPLFTIDWGNALKEHPVDRSTLRGATNILLSMLRYFGNAAIGNVNKKPLLIGVLSTLFSFLSCTKCYELVGTKLLTQQLNSPAISRDVEEIRLDLK